MIQNFHFTSDLSVCNQLGCRPWFTAEYMKNMDIRKILQNVQLQYTPGTHFSFWELPAVQPTLLIALLPIYSHIAICKMVYLLKSLPLLSNPMSTAVHHMGMCSFSSPDRFISLSVALKTGELAESREREYIRSVNPSL